jgi:thymidine phosphorylase
MCLRKRGDEVSAGDPIAEVHARDEASAATAVDEVLAAYEIADAAPPRRQIILETIG